MAERTERVSEKLNHAARRLRAFESERQWAGALVEGAGEFCGRAALFAVEGAWLRLSGVRGLEAPAGFERAPLAPAPAFAGALESKDSMVALRSAGELSEPIAALVGEAPDARFYVFPVIARERVAALLYADAEGRPVDANALEVLAALAGSVLENHTAAADPGGLVKIAPAGAAGANWEA